MKGIKKFHLGNSIPRAVFVGLSVLLQAGWLLVLILELNAYSPGIEIITRILSLLVILHINAQHTDAAYKMPWIMLILAFPVMGVSLYLMLGLFADLGSTGKRIRRCRGEVRALLPDSVETAECLAATDLPGTSVSGYLRRKLDCPVYDGTKAAYFPEATAAFEALKADLEGAESFIFMEYFIVSTESAARELLEILRRKAEQGVEVRFMYDDVGSVGKVNLLFAKKLSDAGIKCMVFNPAVPFLNLFMNHRDHRKITVIDGRIGYTGGFNLSDEYFDRKWPYGKWKDTGVRLEGDAVQSLTAAYLEMWSASSKEAEALTQYFSEKHTVPEADCFVQPYEDDPLSRERAAESVYLNLIYGARESVYIITPYLIITDELANALALAAKRGVDVRIITPGIPDKRIVYAVTRSYYAGLIRQGVRIFEYSPGFCHAKQILCDGKTASIGTSNLDYRSLYLHFENDVLIYGGQAVRQMAEDFEKTFAQCAEVTGQYTGKRSATLRLGQYILRLFAPML